MSPTVSAVIATVGRPTLNRAIRSVLAQTHPVVEVLVVADAHFSISLPDDDRVVLMHSGVGRGPAYCRQLGIDAARGTVIALLDDDDEWYPDKVERQLAAASEERDEWVAFSRMAVIGRAERRRIWPRRLIEPTQHVPDYLFRKTELRAGETVLQTSTLCFPAGLARRIRWDTHAGEVHDEPSWLIAVQQAIPQIRWLHVPDVLSTYDVRGASLSRDHVDRTERYIEWGLRHLRAQSPRVRGDYMCTSPVSAAAAAGSPAGVVRAMAAALRFGRPGPVALAYASGNLARTVSVRIRSRNR